MSGSILAAIITPIVVMPVLAGWLALLYHVGEHPLWRDQAQARAYQLEQAAPPGVGPTQQGIPRTLPH